MPKKKDTAPATSVATTPETGTSSGWQKRTDGKGPDMDIRCDVRGNAWGVAFVSDNGDNAKLSLVKWIGGAPVVTTGTYTDTNAARARADEMFNEL